MERTKNPKISVLMSCYNSEDYLEEAILSILNQTYKNFEFIIIDDGSIDKTPLIIKDYAEKDSRIRPVYQQNIGLTKSLNKGLHLMRGDYLARMDADDISLPERFSNFVQFLNKNGDVQLYSTPAIVFNDQNKIGRVIPNFIRRKFFVKKMLDYYCSLVHGTLIVEKKIIQKLQYDESFVCAQDYDLYCRAIDLGYRISYDNFNITYKLRRHANAVTNTMSKVQINAFKRVLNRRRKKYYKPILINKFFFFLLDILLYAQNRKKKLGSHNN